MLNDLGLHRKEDIAREAHPSRIRKDMKQLKELTDFLTSCKNPFSDENEPLFNISTGKAASNETQKFLLNVREIGEKAMNDYIERCHEDPLSFELPIRRQKISTFANDGKKIKRSCQGIIKEIKMERDMLGKLLMISLNHKLDIGLVLQYPLTPVPLVFSHLDGTINSTDKAVLYKNLEKRVDSVGPEVIDVYIVDGFFFLHLLGPNIPQIYEDIARFILVKLCKLKAKTIHLVFDRILSPSIKDLERDVRSDCDRSTNYGSFGKKQKRPANFLKALRNDSFKIQLVKFLADAFEDDSYINILVEKTVYITEDTNCYSYKVLEDRIMKSKELHMENSHEEADSKV
jgi:hypothetical protein